ncbi:MAG: CopG family transcriptional regulator [Neisseriaceae bacterium]|nr:CopG family transcriptional regulator [Neisseriaceae bacterium]
MPTALQTVTGEIPVSLIEKMDTISARLDCSRNWILQQAISAWVNQEEEYHRMTLQALEEVENGETVSHAEIVSWIERLP